MAGHDVDLDLDLRRRLAAITDPSDKVDLIHQALKMQHGSMQDELPEQLLTAKYLRPDARVLELGGNIGRNSCSIACQLTDDRHLVVMECHPEHAKQLADNKRLNNLRFHIEDAALSHRPLVQNGWVTKPYDGVDESDWIKVKTVTFRELEAKHNMQFDTLVLDCEGAFYYILKDDPDLLKHIQTVIMENDYTDPAQKLFVDKVLEQHGLVSVEHQSGGWGVYASRFYEVFQRPPLVSVRLHAAGIPKVIHQIWIGPKQPPSHAMDTWRIKNPSWEYKLWSMPPTDLINQAQYDAAREWAGKADIWRYEILLKEGGVYIDADSLCLRPLDDSFLDGEFWAAYESEKHVPDLIANGTMGAAPGAAVMKELVRRLGELTPQEVMGAPAWATTGPALLTKVLDGMRNTTTRALPSGTKVYASHLFYPTHHRGRSVSDELLADAYAEQLWGSTFDIYTDQPPPDLRAAFRQRNLYVIWHDPVLGEIGRLYCDVLQRLCQRPCCFMREPPAVWDAQGLYIILGLQAHTKSAPPRESGALYIAPQLEQPHSAAFHSDYVTLLRKAAQVWDFNRVTAHKLTEEHGLTNVVYFQLGYCANVMTPTTCPRLGVTECSTVAHVAFYGGINDRRRQCLQRITDAGLVLTTATYTMFGEEREEWLRATPIVLNVHYYQPPVLEEARILFAMANGHLVVSERTIEPELDAQYAPYVVFVDNGDWAGMARECKYWLNHPVERQARVDAGRVWLATQRDMALHLLPSVLKEALSEPVPTV
jgi:FkbM family methyltransferase